MTRDWLYWHIHHDDLIEISDEISKRRKYVKACKSKNEVPTRLRLMRRVKGPLPASLTDIVTEYLALRRLWKAAKSIPDGRIRAKYFEVQQKLYASLYHNRVRICRLHKKECPNCPWNGSTIFPR